MFIIDLKIKNKTEKLLALFANSAIIVTSTLPLKENLRVKPSFFLVVSNE